MTTLDFEALGKKIRYFRKFRNLTQAALGKQIGVTQKYVSNIENAKSVPTLQTLVRMCNVMEIMPSALLEDSIVFSRPELSEDALSFLERCSKEQIARIASFFETMQEEQTDNELIHK